MFCEFCQTSLENKYLFKEEYCYCPKCRHLIKLKMASIEEQKIRYDAHICDVNYHKYMANVYNAIKPFIVGKSILDYGCGKVKALEKMLKIDKYDAYSYDLFYYPKLVKKLYDTIILIEVIEHIEDTNYIFNQLISLLNSGGRIIIMTNFLPNNFENWWYLRDITHVNFYSLEFFNRLASYYNLQIIFCNDKNLIILQK